MKYKLITICLMAYISISLWASNCPAAVPFRSTTSYWEQTTETKAPACTGFRAIAAQPAHWETMALPICPPKWQRPLCLPLLPEQNIPNAKLSTLRTTITTPPTVPPSAICCSRCCCYLQDMRCVCLSDAKNQPARKNKHPHYIQRQSIRLFLRMYPRGCLTSMVRQPPFYKTTALPINPR